MCPPGKVYFFFSGLESFFISNEFPSEEVKFPVKFVIEDLVIEVSLTSLNYLMIDANHNIFEEAKNGTFLVKPRRQNQR